MAAQGKSLPGRGPEAGACLLCLGNIKETSVAGLGGGRGKRWEKEAMVGSCRLLEKHWLSL